MSRFVLVSFAGLALAFYELSGGADFAPPERPVTDVAQEQTSTARERGRIVSRPAETQLVNPILTPYFSASGSVVADGGADLITATATAATGSRVEPAVERTGTEGAAAVSISLRDPASVVSLPQPISLNLPVTGLRIASVEAGLGAITAEAPEPTRQAIQPEPIGEFRKVRASRANVRLGPGTNYPVLMQLLAGDNVRVLNDDESGWSLLENPKTGQVGWIAASLLSAKQS